MPARWDFPHVDDDEFSLPEVQTGTWGGFVFINPDPNAEPPAAFVSELAAHFDQVWNLEHSITERHVAKNINDHIKLVADGVST